MSNRELGYVSGEGGPMLLADRDTAKRWHGSEGDDYERACEILGESADSLMISIAGEDAVLWEMGGAGTAYVFKEDDAAVALVRCWPNRDMQASDFVGATPVEARRVGSLQIKSGVLCILWAPENGSVLDFEPKSEASRPQGELAIHESALLVAVPNGTYAVFCDEYQLNAGSARRCRLVRETLHESR